VTDIMSKEKRSALMSRIKGADTSIELAVVNELRKRSVKLKRYERSLPGRPDIVLPDTRMVIFIDGDFWHGWRFSRWSGKLSPLWREKIERNRRRDQRNVRKLRRLGWKVMRVWEHQIERNLDRCILRILTYRGPANDTSMKRSSNK
jgi:DNA mismatch endonuclease (patch repair protein)